MGSVTLRETRLSRPQRNLFISMGPISFSAADALSRDLGAPESSVRSCGCRPRHPPPSRTSVTNYSLSHLPDETLLRQLDALVARDQITTAQLLAHLAEVDERRLYAS